MWNPFKKKDPLEGQRANYTLAFDIIPKVLNEFRTGNMPLTELEDVSTFINFADDNKNVIKWKKDYDFWHRFQKLSKQAYDNNSVSRTVYLIKCKGWNNCC